MLLVRHLACMYKHEEGVGPLVCMPWSSRGPLFVLLASHAAEKRLQDARATDVHRNSLSSGAESGSWLVGREVLAAYWQHQQRAETEAGWSRRGLSRASLAWEECWAERRLLHAHVRDFAVNEAQSGPDAAGAPGPVLLTAKRGGHFSLSLSGSKTCHLLPQAFATGPKEYLSHSVLLLHKVYRKLNA